MNPNLEEAGKETQFAIGDGRKRGGDKAWSIRNQVRYLAGQPINPNSETPFEDSLKEIPKPTGAQFIAARALDAAVSGDVRMIEYATDIVDGKLAHTMVNADMTSTNDLAEEDRAILAQYLKT